MISVWKNYANNLKVIIFFNFSNQQLFKFRNLNNCNINYVSLAIINQSFFKLYFTMIYLADYVPNRQQSSYSTPT